MPDNIGARDLVAAFRGNQAAVVKLMRHGFQRHRKKAMNLRREIEHRRRNEWDAEAAREAAMNGEVPPEQTIGAFADLHRSLLSVLAYTPAALIADEGEMQAISEEWTNALYELAIRLHNPTIKYGIVGGFRPEAREEVEDYLNRYNREIWGVILALTSEGEVDVGDLPPETGSVIEAIARNRQQAGD